MELGCHVVIYVYKISGNQFRASGCVSLCIRAKESLCLVSLYSTQIYTHVRVCRWICVFASFCVCQDLVKRYTRGYVFQRHVCETTHFFGFLPHSFANHHFVSLDCTEVYYVLRFDLDFIRRGLLSSIARPGHFLGLFLSSTRLSSTSRRIRFCLHYSQSITRAEEVPSASRDSTEAKICFTFHVYGCVAIFFGFSSTPHSYLQQTSSSHLSLLSSPRFS